MRIETLYDQGSVLIPEDRIILCPPFFGVADGVSGLYIPSEGPTYFDGKTGGEMAAESLVQAFAVALPEESPKDILQTANEAIRQAQEPLGFYASGEIERLAGTAFAVAKIDAEEIEIYQCGDCLALWVPFEGKFIGVKVTPNQALSHEIEARQIIAELMMKHAGDRNRMWQEFGPILATMRRQRVNRTRGYGLLNGQLESQEMWQRFVIARQDIVFLLLFTDGLVSYEELDPINFVLSRGGDLSAILKETRLREEGSRGVSHIDHAEASGVAIVL